MKKIIYVILFTVLGVLISSILHVIIEMWYIGFLVYDFKKFSLGLSWVQLYLLHSFFTVAFFVVGVLAGFFQGLFWWKIIYERKKSERIFRFHL